MCQSGTGVTWNLIEATACQQRVPEVDRGVEFGSVCDFAAEGIASQDGEPCVESANQGIHGNARAIGPNGRDRQLPRRLKDPEEDDPVALICGRVTLFQFKVVAVEDEIDSVLSAVEWNLIVV